MKKLILLILTILTFNVQADTLNVAIRITPPYTNQIDSNLYVGSLINLFEKSAYPFTYKLTPIYDMENLDSLMDEYDLFLGVFGMTSDREHRFDMSHSFHHST